MSEEKKQSNQHDELMKFLFEMREEKKDETKKKWKCFFCMLPLILFATIYFVWDFMYILDEQGFIYN